MAPEEIKKQVFEALIEVAPEVDPLTIDPDVSFRDQFEIDSVDFLNFALNLEKQLSIRIPETDYPKLSSLKGCLKYFECYAFTE